MQTIAHHQLIAPMAADRSGSTWTLWTGRGLSGLAVLLLALDSIGKLLEVQPVIDGTIQLGYPRDIVFTLGVVLLSSVVIYAIPATSVLGAVLLTGYLGGAVATHVRVGDPLFSHILFPTYVGALVWGSLMLRDPRLRALLPLRMPNSEGGSTSPQRGGRHE